MKEIPLTQGQVALVDDADYDQLIKFNWSARFNKHTGTFIAKRTVWLRGTWRSVQMHVEICKPPKGLQVDHRDLNSLNNQRANLRICTNQQNSCNQGIRRNNTLGVKGVCRNNQGRFTARITVAGKRRSVGTFTTLVEAAAAYDKAARAQYGEFARTNQECRPRAPIFNSSKVIPFAPRRRSRAGLKRRYRGVFPAPTGRPGFMAAIQYKRVHYHLGKFATAEEAALAYNAAATRIHGQFASLNQISEKERVA